MAGDHGYSETASLMEELLKEIEGYLGIEYASEELESPFRIEVAWKVSKHGS